MAKPIAKAPTTTTSSSSSTLSNAYCADYGSHNATTFDPYANKTNNGNYGIQSINHTITIALKNYHNKSIAATQVDVVGHSMGGLMARGYTQQQDYKNPHNYMKGYIHRLITIGTPHFGGQLAGPLYNHRENWYCFDPNTNIPVFPAGCQFNL
jgi:triacylglycerol esterase/lipase EstA (alpha/beta hydrolase family)